MTSLASLVQEAMAEDEALARLRGTLSEEDRAALDAAFGALGEYQLGAAMASSFSAFDKVLLLMLVKQSRRVECLEVLLQRISVRLLEMS